MNGMTIVQSVLYLLGGFTLAFLLGCVVGGVMVALGILDESEDEIRPLRDNEGTIIGAVHTGRRREEAA